MSARNTSPGAPGHDSQSNVLCRRSSIGLNASPRALHGLMACVTRLDLNLEQPFRSRMLTVARLNFAYFVLLHRGTSMVVNVQGLTLPEGAKVDFRFEMTAQANITAFVARQKVTQFVIMEISSQMRGGIPDLNVGERLSWSVPVELTSPARGVVGRVGEIRVDATTGELLTDSDTLRGIADNARLLVERAAL